MTNKKKYQKTLKYLEKLGDKDISSKMGIIDSILIKESKEEQIEYLYDLLCDYLDNEFYKKNICGFNCGICKKRQWMINKGIKKDTYLNGCCYSYINKTDCKYLKNGKCSTQNLGCKLFTCNYLKKRGYSYSLNDIYLSKYLLNYRQKYYIEYSIKLSKEEIVNGIIKRI